MRSQIEKYRGQAGSSDTQRKKAVRDLEEKLQRTEKKAAEYDGKAFLVYFVKKVNKIRISLKKIKNSYVLFTV